jgi:hypothetical protein
MALKSLTSITRMPPSLMKVRRPSRLSILTQSSDAASTLRTKAISLNSGASDIGATLT